MTVNTLSQEYLKECLQYDEETGALFWRMRPLNHFSERRPWAIWNSSFAYRIAGSYTGSSHRVRIRLDDKSYFAHHLVWLYHHGVLPTDPIDHINHDVTDNRIQNLREVPHKENARNQSRRVTSTSGVNGVCRNGKRNNWRAHIVVDGKQIGLGVYDSIQEAEIARLEADIEYGFHANHGAEKAPLQFLHMYRHAEHSGRVFKNPLRRRHKDNKAMGDLIKL